MRTVGFVRRVVEFQEHLIFDWSAVNASKLETGKVSLEDVLQKVRRRAAERKMVEVDPHNEEQIRRDQALARIRDNRLARLAPSDNRVG